MLIRLKCELGSCINSLVSFVNNYAIVYIIASFISLAPNLAPKILNSNVHLSIAVHLFNKI